MRKENLQSDTASSVPEFSIENIQVFSAKSKAHGVRGMRESQFATEVAGCGL